MGSDLTVITSQWRSSVICGTVSVLQPHVLHLQPSRDLTNAGGTVVSVVLLVVIDCLVYEEDPVVQVFVGGGAGRGGRFVLLEVVPPLEVVGVHLVPGHKGVLVPISEEPAVPAALQPPVVGVHVARLVGPLPPRPVP